MSINYSELSITVITNVLFISLFIALFFFTYVAYIEGIIVKKQMALLSDEITSAIKILGPDITKEIKEYVNKLPPLDLDEEDEKVKQLNSKTKYNAIMANVIFTVIVLVTVIYIYKASDKSFLIKDILIKNGIILFFIALTEFGFLTYFGANYISINPNTIIYNIIQKIKKIIT